MVGTGNAVEEWEEFMGLARCVDGVAFDSLGNFCRRYYRQLYTFSKDSDGCWCHKQHDSLGLLKPMFLWICRVFLLFMKLRVSFHQDGSDDLHKAVSAKKSYLNI